MTGDASGRKRSRRTWRDVWEAVEEKIEEAGLDLSELIGEESGAKAKVKVVCIDPDMGATVRDLGKEPRENVVMVRVDDDTLKKLDAWVETDAVKSRSEAAALFIREGLQVRGDELGELEDALKRVENAKQKLRDKAKSVFGSTGDEEETS